MPEDDARMTLVEHLAELRKRLMWSLAVIGICMVVCFGFSNQLFALIARPLLPLQGQQAAITEAESPTSAPTAETPEAQPKEKSLWIALSPMEGFTVSFKLAGYGGLVLAFPFVLYQICAFVFPGLKPKERRAAQFLIAGSSILVIVGVCVAYFMILPVILQYLAAYLPPSVELKLRMRETIGLILAILMGFAIAFQFPMVVLVLVYLELLDPASLRKWRRMAIVGIAIASAILTPPDPFSMMMMMIPLLILYEMSIWLSYLIVRKRQHQVKDAFTPSGE